MQEFRQIERFPNYWVSDYGVVVYSDPDGTPLKPHENQQGHISVALYRDGQPHRRSVAKVVADAFLPQPLNRHYNSILHLNNDRTDNRASNLMWRPKWFVIEYHKQFRNMTTQELYTPVVLSESKEEFTLEEFCRDFGALPEYVFVTVNNQGGGIPFAWVNVDAIPKGW